MKDIVGAMLSFARWLRIERSRAAVSKRTEAIITSQREVRRAPRPAYIEHAGLELVDLLCDLGSPFFHIFRPRAGGREKLLCFKT